MRRQSFYLILVAGLMTLLAVMPLAELTGVGGAAARLEVWQIQFSDAEPLSLWYFGATTAAAAFWAVVCLALRKKRRLQLRMTYVLLVLTIGVVAFTVFYGLHIYRSDYAVDFSPLVLLPLFCVPLVWMARGGMIRDLALLESYERMR